MVMNPLANRGDRRDRGSKPGSGRSPGEGHKPTPVFLPGVTHDRRAWRATGVT